MTEKSIRELRHDKGMSISEVADVLGCTPTDYMTAELFPETMTVKQLKMICIVLDVPEDVAIDTQPLCDENDFTAIARLVLSEIRPV